jgi:KH domain
MGVISLRTTIQHSFGAIFFGPRPGYNKRSFVNTCMSSPSLCVMTYLLVAAPDVSDVAASSSSAAYAPTPVDQFLFKMLCPANVTGSIIGRGGQVLQQIGDMSGAKVRVSQNQEFYPGTSDRIMLISGPKRALVIAVGELTAKILEVSQVSPVSYLSVVLEGRPG